MLRKHFAVLSLFVLLAGCATIKHGTKQDIPIDSEPSGAKVYVDGAYVGDTPTEVSLTRDEEHRIGLAMGGHEVGMYELKPTLSYDVFYNFSLLPGVFAGFLIDSLTGGLYELSVVDIDHHMVKQEEIPQVQ